MEEGSKSYSWCSFSKFKSYCKSYKIIDDELKQNRYKFLNPNDKGLFLMRKDMMNEISTVDSILSAISKKDPQFAELLRQRFIEGVSLNDLNTKDNKNFYLCSRQLKRIYKESSWEEKYNEILGNNL